MLGIGGRSGAGRWRRGAVAAATALVMFSIPAAAQASSTDAGAPVRIAQSAGIADRYIVVLKGALPTTPTEKSEQAATKEDAKVASSVNAKPLFEYDAAMKGFVADLTRMQLRELRHSSQVKYVEQDARVEELDTQRGATWGLTRIDERSLNLDGIYNYPSTAGAGVHVFILDTGVQADNVDFGSRASNPYDAIGGRGSGSDCNGHGTHVAGTVGGATYGVAKRAKLFGIRVLGCGGSGSIASVIAGVNWVTEHHVADRSVANMSLGAGASQAMDDAVNLMIESGVFVSVAAGNNNADACNYSPARTPAAFTTAASDSQDRKATFSNWGRCVDSYAPGVAITSAWIGSNTAINTISGTSMAAPAVAGTAALYLAGHVSTPAGTATSIVDHATTGVIGNNKPDTPNRLLYVGDL